jgi:hypothetical protein
MHPNISYEFASTRIAELRRVAGEQNAHRERRLAGTGGLRRYFGHAGKAHKHSLRGARG